MEEFNNYSNMSVTDSNKLLMKTFGWMFLGLISTAIVGFATYSSSAFSEIIGMWPILALIEVVIVFAFHGLLRRAPAGVVLGLFFAYAMLNGLTLSAIFAFYELGSIAYAFFGTAALFGGLALVGYTTNRDISGLGTILGVGLIVSLIVSIINLFIGSSSIEILLNWVVIALFCGYTIFDINKLKLMAESGEFPEEKVSIYCALELYLDFINLFIRLLRLFGKARD